ncbi:MAG: tetratricopeptide repeat protein [Treponema sp.]|nr:tetratricopeptide repeat protein [Treponema sp.]
MKVYLNKSTLCKTILILFFICVFCISCDKSPDENTIRLYVRASDAYAQGCFLEVIEILDGQENFPPALILRAKAEYFFGDLENAEKSCRRVIKLRPSSFEAGLYLARILRENGDLAEARLTVHELLADNPQDIRALRLAAELACDEEKFDEAAIFLDRAAEYSAESAMVLLDRARLYWIAGKSEHALDDLSRAKAMLPWDTPLLRSIVNLENIIKEVM